MEAANRTRWCDGEACENLRMSIIRWSGSPKIPSMTSMTAVFWHMGRNKFGLMDDAWDVLLLALPRDWRKLARETGASKGLRRVTSADNLLRVLLLHLGCGHSLERTAQRQAALANLPIVSPEALLKRLRKSEDWLHALCAGLFNELDLALIPGDFSQVRVVDTATVEKRSGSSWRVHYSVSLPLLACDVKVTETEGPGTGRSVARFPIRTGDHVLIGPGHSNAGDIRHVAEAGGRLIVPADAGFPPLCTPAGQPFDLQAEVASAQRAGADWPWATKVVVPGDDDRPAGETEGRICVLRKSPEGVRLAHEQVRGDAPAEYVSVFTTFPDQRFPPADVLEWYRLHQRLELVFEHFRALAQLGQVPKSEKSTNAWFYGKLFMALLMEKLSHRISPLDNAPARGSEQQEFVFDAVAKAIDPPPLMQLRRAPNPLTKKELQQRVRLRQAARKHGSPEPALRRLYRDRLRRLEDLVSRCA